jgi:thiol-disulfide isomerase/thioredoxin
VVLVNFWATWCPPCRKEIPSLTRLQRMFKPEQLRVLAVNVGED